MSTKIKKYKVGRRLGPGVYDKCQSQKFLLSQAKKTKRGGRPKRPTDYGYSLLDKQRIRFAYGISERQFRNYVNRALKTRSKKNSPAQILFQDLEKRIDNVLYRAGFAPTRRAARQIVSHGHIVIDDKKTTIPSASLSVGQKTGIRKGSKTKTIFQDMEKKLKSTTVPVWLKVDAKKAVVELVGDPKDIDPFMNFQAVIEFYSR